MTLPAVLNDKKTVTTVKERIAGQVRLVQGRDARLRTGYLWVFAGEIAQLTGDPRPGALVDVLSATGDLVGRGFFNSHSKIRVRLLTLDDRPIDEAFWAERIAAALALRARVVADTNAYRLVHGEGDLLPGLIVDRYGDVLVMQTLAAGMEVRKDLLADLLLAQTRASAVYLRNDVSTRNLEGLPMARGFLRGDGPTLLEIYEGKARFRVNVEQGQKTGWFCDQRENRIAVAALAGGAEVLEPFCHTGAFGIHAALQGAQSVLGMDASPDAVKAAEDHASLNEVGEQCRYREGDAFEELRRLERRGASFDVIILDPPAFAKSRRTVTQALSGYKEINRRAFRLLRKDGVLATCSCSHHVQEAVLRKTVLEAAREARRRVQFLESRSQAADHPTLDAMPETQYLKCFLLRVC